MRMFEQYVDSEDLVFWAREVDSGRVIHVSSGFADVWGVEPERLYQNPEVWLECIHPEDRLRVAEALDRWLHTGEGKYLLQYRVVLPNGSERLVLDRGVICERDSQRVGFAAGIVRDISDARKAAQVPRTEPDNGAESTGTSDTVDMPIPDIARRPARSDRIVGEGPGVASMMQQVEQVAPTNATVLILGETGSGKELVARKVHRSSCRCSHAFVKVNCAALPDSLIESELFGHLKGAFTGAISDRTGRFEMANRGTIFLDEIGEMNIDLQAKLLHVLQEGEFERIGSSETVHVDVRVVAATNRDLAELVEQGRFRADLYYRLAVFPIVVPPLRQRREDIPLLVWDCVRRAANMNTRPITTIPTDVMQKLVDYDWPGNVRELENVIERAVIMSKEGHLIVDLPGNASLTAERSEVFSDSGNGPNADNGVSDDSDTLDGIERRHITRVLEACNWQIKGSGRAAERLGLAPSTLRYRMAKLGIRRTDKTKPR